jgi:hypothetical protein
MVGPALQGERGDSLVMSRKGASRFACEGETSLLFSSLLFSSLLFSSLLFSSLLFSSLLFSSLLFSLIVPFRDFRGVRLPGHAR